MLTTPTAAPLLVLLSLLGGEAASTPRSAAPSSAVWTSLAEGIETATFPLSLPASASTTSEDRAALSVTVVRVDPARAELRAHLASEPGERPRTAGDWCQAKGLVAAINLGMYKNDQISNVGYARKAQHENNGRLNDYRSFLGFGPRRTGIPAARLWDSEDAEAKGHLGDYDVVIQNLRLVRGGGVSVWKSSPRRWSEAAIAGDRQGRILFLFVATPLAMNDLTSALLALPLDIDRAMHVEGGPEASLSVCARGHRRDLNGAFVNGILAEMPAPSQMPIPNVIGVAVRATPAPPAHVTTLPH